MLNFYPNAAQRSSRRTSSHITINYDVSEPTRKLVSKEEKIFYKGRDKLLYLWIDVNEIFLDTIKKFRIETTKQNQQWRKTILIKMTLAYLLYLITVTINHWLLMLTNILLFYNKIENRGTNGAVKFKNS
jgi:hypothetical protein